MRLESMTGFEYIRRRYGVPARRGAVVYYKGRRGTVTSSYSSGRVLIRLEGDRRALIYHPTDEDLVWEKNK